MSSRGDLEEEIKMGKMDNEQHPELDTANTLAVWFQSDSFNQGKAFLIGHTINKKSAVNHLIENAKKINPEMVAESYKMSQKNQHPN